MKKTGSKSGFCVFKNCSSCPAKNHVPFFSPPICENRVWHVFFPPFFAGNQCTRECFTFSLNPFFPRKKNISRRGKITGSRKYVAEAGLLPCVCRKRDIWKIPPPPFPRTRKKEKKEDKICGNGIHTHTLMLGKSVIFFLPSSVRGKREREKIRESLRCNKRNWKRRRRS